MIAALFIPAPWPGIVLLGIALALGAICAWQFLSPLREGRHGG